MRNLESRVNQLLRLADSISTEFVADVNNGNCTLVIGLDVKGANIKTVAIGCVDKVEKVKERIAKFGEVKE